MRIRPEKGEGNNFVFSFSLELFQRRTDTESVLVTLHFNKHWDFFHVPLIVLNAENKNANMTSFQPLSSPLRSRKIGICN